MGVELIHFEETELRLGLPGGKGSCSEITGGGPETAKNNGNKRGFSETVDLKLNLSSKDSGSLDQVDKKDKATSVAAAAPSTDSVKPPAK